MEETVAYSRRSKEILDAVNEAYKEMLLEKARLGQVVVTDNEAGEMEIIDARIVYERVYGPIPPLPAVITPYNLATAEPIVAEPTPEYASK